MKTSEVYEIALKEIGVQEIVGQKANPRIVEYHGTTSLNSHSDEVPWCAAFVNWVFERAHLNGTGLANARSFCFWGSPCPKPVKGDLAIFWRDSPSGKKGHVGFYAGEVGPYILVLGGNQGNKVCIMKYPKTQLITFRKLSPK